MAAVRALVPGETDTRPDSPQIDEGRLTPLANLRWRPAALALRSLGLVDVEAGTRGARGWLQGVLAGSGAGEIVLVGVCGSGLDWRWGACGALVAALDDLRRTPLRHAVRVLLLAGPGAAEEWMESEMGPEPSEILAVLELAPIAGGGTVPVLLTLPVETDEGRRLVPGWLVHALLHGGRSVGLVPVVLDGALSLPTQLIVRASHTDRRAVAQVFLDRGVPAITLADRSLLADRFLLSSRSKADDRALAARAQPVFTPAVKLLAPTVRRLDSLAARPTDEDQYLVFGDRVWLRRDLYWLGFAVWVILVLSGTPGRWRGASSVNRRARGSQYLPAFAFRILFLISLLVTPIMAVPLLVPPALLSLVRIDRPWARQLLPTAGLLPSLGLVIFWWWSRENGTITGYAGTGIDLLLLATTLVAFTLGAGRRSPRR